MLEAEYKLEINEWPVSPTLGPWVWFLLSYLWEGSQNWLLPFLFFLFLFFHLLRAAQPEALLPRSQDSF
jgi:hypothetical protein